MMTFWNLLVIICFFVLYLAVTLVYIQVRRLREEIKSPTSENNAHSPHTDPTLDEEGEEGPAAPVRPISPALAALLNPPPSAVAS
ncbi:MAG: hypothetical protein HQL51_03370, partial [Magnetococcales bacterium]|nr:hypothetical protein [Magnetococcales bacterium]